MDDSQCLRKIKRCHGWKVHNTNMTRFEWGYVSIKEKKKSPQRSPALKNKKKILTPAWFEHAHLTITELESAALDRSATEPYWAKYPLALTFEFGCLEISLGMACCNRGFSLIRIAFQNEKNTCGFTSNSRMWSAWQLAIFSSLHSRRRLLLNFFTGSAGEKKILS